MVLGMCSMWYLPRKMPPSGRTVSEASRLHEFVSVTVKRRGNADILMARVEAIAILMSLVRAETHRHWHHQTQSQRSRRFSQSMDSNSTAHEWDETKF